MKNIESMMQKMQTMQAEIESSVVVGKAGGDLVHVSLNGKGDLTELRIDPSLLVPGEKEILEDLLIAAHADAKRKIDDVQRANLQKMTNGLGLPPGFKLPF